MVLNLNVLAHFQVVRSTMSLSPVIQVWRHHVDGMVGLAFNHLKVYSSELRSLMEIGFYSLHAFNHVFELQSLVDVVYYLTLHNDVSFKDTPLGCNI